MERITFLFFFTLISIFFDIYFYQIVKKYNRNKWIKFLIPIYWSFTIITITNFFLYAFQFELGYYYKTITFNIIIGNFISKVLSLPFILIDDLRRLIIYIFRKKSSNSSQKISRSKFLSISASLAYGLPITSLTYGILSNNVYDYRIKRREIELKKLPIAFDGIKVCHISDIHVGSLRNRLAVR